MFWRGKEAREVDFVVSGDSAMTPVEVKFQEQISKEDLYPMADFRKVSGSKGGVVLSKNTLETRNGYSIVPVSTFLLLV